MADERWKTDTEFTELPLEKVERSSGGGYALTRKGDWGTLWIGWPGSAGLGFEPRVGQMARFYGRGDGFPVRGVVIDGQVCRYQTAEEEAEESKKRSEEFDVKVKAQEQATADAGRTEASMREQDAPWPKTVDELTSTIKALVDGPHTYGTRVYAMSLASVAAFHFVAHVLGVTGFQASCADLDIVRRTRHLKGPFMLVKGEDALYPQLDPLAKVRESLAQWRPWMAEEARKRLAENPTAHPDVVAHWRMLAAHADATVRP